MEHEYYIVDVFAEEKYQGNQLAVFTDGSSLSSEEMQNIAREINYSETTFIIPEHSGDDLFKVRIFTPKHEIPFAGHPTLGTAFIIQNCLQKHKTESVVLDLQAGKIPVRIDTDKNGSSILWMTQNQPVFGKTIDPDQAAAVLGLETDEIDPANPVQEVSTGLPFIIVPVRSREILNKAKTNIDLMNKLVNGLEAKAMCLYTTDTKGRMYDIEVRVFVDYYGIPEDPATGSANGCLAAYLLEYKVFNSDAIDIIASQGAVIQRPSRLYIKSSKSSQKFDLQIGGKVVKIAHGVFY